MLYLIFVISNKIDMTKNIFLLLVILGFVFNCAENTNAKVSEDKRVANALINETSPYLLQHAYNPVDWKAWNPETLELAKKENKLIIISVGYSACHWCHVMEEESFENDSIAKIMNDNFINIKVDREERPDVDQVYMNAVQLMTGGGGWPLNCITLPDGRPVFGGTYFSPQQWQKILEDMSELYRNDPDKVLAFADNLTEGIKNSNLITINKEEVPFKKDQFTALVNEIKTNLDLKEGGQKGAPKFPMPDLMNFLLRSSFQLEDIDLHERVELSLTKMANGGLYDQIGGGFSRYSVDDRWHVPHFEKMLYDNAQLVSLYANAYQLTKNENFATIVKETLDFVDRELTAPNGTFYSSLDADSKNAQGEKEEGAFYFWTKDELQSLLNDDYKLFSAYYNINAIGKWEKNTYILYKTEGDIDFASANNLTIEAFQSKLSEWKDILLNARNSRERPATDDKILTSWNALMLQGYVDAYKVFRDKAYLDKAITNAQFIIDNQLTDDGLLYHSFKDGKSSIIGFSEDYAQTIAAFIALYQSTLDQKWLDISKTLTEYCLDHYGDEKTGMIFFTSDSETDLITRKIEFIDNVIPSSNSVMAENLFKLGHYFADRSYSDKAQQMLKNMNDGLMRSPSGYSNWLELYLNYSNPYYEVAIAGQEAKIKLEEINRFYNPNILIAGTTKDSKLPLLDSKFNEEDTYIYVCVNGSCKLPVIDTEQALKQLLK